MKNSNYITLPGWVFNELNLKGNDALIYAIIYGFSQDGISRYTGSSKYIINSIKISRNTALKSLDKLQDSGLIIKSKVENNNIIYNEFVVNFKRLGFLNSGNRGSAETALGSAEIDKGSAEIDILGSAETAHNNTIIYNTSKKDFRAFDFFKKENPIRFESWLMKNQKRIKNFVKFINHFNNKFDEEELNYTVKVIEARLSRFCDNWSEVEQKDNVKIEVGVLPQKWS